MLLIHVILLQDICVFQSKAFGKVLLLDGEWLLTLAAYTLLITYC